MTNNEIDDETLMAYADGELDASQVAKVETALRDDPGLARRLSIFSDTRDVLTSAAAVERDAPVPEDVLARAKAAVDGARHADGEKVVPLFRPEPRYWVWQSALAAGLAVAAFLGGYVLSPSGPDSASGELRFAILDTPGVSLALDSVPAGARSVVAGGEIAIIASFRDAEGALCREFEIDTVDLLTVVSVACRAEDRWNPMIAVVATADDDTQYAPASSLETLDAYLSAIGAGAPLEPEQEDEALSAFN